MGSDFIEGSYYDPIRHDRRERLVCNRDETKIQRLGFRLRQLAPDGTALRNPTRFPFTESRHFVSDFGVSRRWVPSGTGGQRNSRSQTGKHLNSGVFFTKWRLSGEAPSRQTQEECPPSNRSRADPATLRDISPSALQRVEPAFLHPIYSPLFSQSEVFGLLTSHPEWEILTASWAESPILRSR